MIEYLQLRSLCERTQAAYASTCSQLFAPAESPYSTPSSINWPGCVFLCVRWYCGSDRHRYRVGEKYPRKAVFVRHLANTFVLGFINREIASNVFISKQRRS